MNMRGCPGCGQSIPGPWMACHTCEATLPVDLRVRMEAADPWSDTTEYLNARTAVRAWFTGRMEGVVTGG